MPAAPSSGTSLQWSRTGRRRGRWPRWLAGAAAALVATSGLAACGSGSGGPPTLNWYINPDSGGQVEIAARCSAASKGAYRIATSLLPRDAASQREQLVRRLAAHDSSIDLMSLDPPFIPEFSQAGFLAPVPADVVQRVSDDVVRSSIEGATWNGKLVTVPFWANTQLLWYRKSVAQKAGLDLSRPVTWDQLVQAAQSQGVLIGAQGTRAESLTVWLNALVASAGGKIISKNSTNPKEIQLGLASQAGDRAVQVMREVARSSAAGPAFSNEDEDASATGFEGTKAGFMVNWPFIWPRALGKVEKGSLARSVTDDYGWAIYPRVDADKPSAPPYGGINLGVSAFGNHTGAAYQAAECIVSDENQSYYFVSNGNPASSKAVYQDPKVLQEFPMAPTILQSLDQAAPRPQTPYYSEISGGIQQSYHPPADIDPKTTPGQAADLITAVLRKERLL